MYCFYYFGYKSENGSKPISCVFCEENDVNFRNHKQLAGYRYQKSLEMHLGHLDDDETTKKTEGALLLEQKLSWQIIAQITRLHFTLALVIQ